MIGAPVIADGLRVASYHTELKRDGPGLLMRDILRDKDPQLGAIYRVLTITNPDVVVLQGFDYDLTGAALNAFADRLGTDGPYYPYRFANRPNTGMPTVLDMDGDGRLGGPGDAQGFGRFSGQGGMAILSKHPILEDEVQDFSAVAWRELPGALLPVTDDNAPFPSAGAQAIQRLSSVAHWVVPIELPDKARIDLLAFHATPPVFDGPEDRNGKRNHDEIIFWNHFLNGHIGTRPAGPFVVLGVANT
ncbi:MAG: endonuclease/exonuclease/phosphatase family protein, partial [Sulfitobacter sp.]